MVRNRPTLLLYSEEGLHLPFLLLYNKLIGVSGERERQGLYEMDKDSKLDKEENRCNSGNGADSADGVLLCHRNGDYRI